jgi:hypothetical protein
MATPGNFGGGSTGPDQVFLGARVFPIGPGGPQSGFSALRYVPSTKGLSQNKNRIRGLPAPPPVRCQIWPSFWGLSPVVFCCLPVTRIWPLLFLHYRDNAKLELQLLLLEVLHSTERWIAVP